MLEQSEPPFGRQRNAEHLVDRREHPETARSVQVQEITVGNLPVKHLFGEDEHEPFFHRRTVVAQQSADRNGNDDGDQREGDCITPIPARGRTSDGC